MYIIIIIIRELRCEYQLGIGLRSTDRPSFAASRDADARDL